MWSRPIPSPWHVFKQDLMKLNFQTVRYAADAMRILNGARLSVNGLYSKKGVDWLIAAGINFSSTKGDVQAYGGSKAIKKDETFFAAYDKAEMRNAKIMIVASSDFVYTSKSLFWPDVIVLPAVDLDLMQSVSMAIGVQRQTEMSPITIVFAGMNDHLHSRGFLSRLREPTTAEDAVWPAIKDILESMGEVVDTLKEGAFTKITPRAVFALSPGYAQLPHGLKFVFAMMALLSQGKYDVIISAPNRGIEMKNLRGHSGLNYLRCGLTSQVRCEDLRTIHYTC